MKDFDCATESTFYADAQPLIVFINTFFLTLYDISISNVTIYFSKVFLVIYEHVFQQFLHIKHKFQQLLFK